MNEYNQNSINSTIAKAITEYLDETCAYEVEYDREDREYWIDIYFEADENVLESNSHVSVILRDDEEMMIQLIHMCPLDDRYSLNDGYIICNKLNEKNEYLRFSFVDTSGARGIRMNYSRYITPVKCGREVYNAASIVAIVGSMAMSYIENYLRWAKKKGFFRRSMWEGFYEG